MTPAAPSVALTQPTCAVATGTITVTAPVPGVGITYTVTGTSPVVAPVTNATGVFAGLTSGCLRCNHHQRSRMYFPGNKRNDQCTAGDPGSTDRCSDTTDLYISHRNDHRNSTRSWQRNHLYSYGDKSGCGSSNQCNRSICRPCTGCLRCNHHKWSRMYFPGNKRNDQCTAADPGSPDRCFDTTNLYGSHRNDHCNSTSYLAPELPIQLQGQIR